MPIAGADNWSIDTLFFAREVEENGRWDVWFPAPRQIQSDVVLGTAIVINDVGGKAPQSFSITAAFATDAERAAVEAKDDGLVHTVTSPTGRTRSALVVAEKLLNERNGFFYLELTFYPA